MCSFSAKKYKHLTEVIILVLGPFVLEFTAFRNVLAL